MKNLTCYYHNIIEYDLLNKFNYNHISNITKLKSISLNFLIYSQNIKEIINALAILELITGQKAKIKLYSKYISKLKIKKGNISNCQVVLNITNQNKFLFYLIENKFLIKLKKNKNKLSSSYYNLLLKLNLNYFFFNNQLHYFFIKDLKKVNINIKIKSKNKYELFFLLQAFKFKIKFL